MNTTNQSMKRNPIVVGDELSVSEMMKICGSDYDSFEEDHPIFVKYDSPRRGCAEYDTGCLLDCFPPQ